MGKATTPMQCGFLVMLALLSGTSEISALECHLAGSYQAKGSSVYTSKDPPYLIKRITCSEGENACMEAQVILRTDQSMVTVIDRSCAKSEGIYGTASNLGDPHIGITYDVRYCFTDLCNNKMSTDIPWNPGNDTAPGDRGSNQCYSGFAYRSPWRVTCRKGYSQCYKGSTLIRAGRYGVFTPIQTCRTPDCVAPKNFTFGPIEFSQRGSCCQGNYCNAIETTLTTSSPTSFTKLEAEWGKESEPPTAGIGH